MLAQRTPHYTFTTNNAVQASRNKNYIQFIPTYNEW